ncbi:hypothetical protein TanjilG_19401 [Lupinus angustifolius]|uniref:Fe2OG dioxygenase domain-containing protein n=1 Tax=Lupinus angustifolius TaxID=3871 RepID=A0A4P1R4F5_LUPAN|nr:PREDICTED: protein DMR6-LIKE OXYGENASE 2-like [Lupinus angustifolius]OIW01475.1 hypothetical protein TanjilG_19401 [Lupinus angustifolius]
MSTLPVALSPQESGLSYVPEAYLIPSLGKRGSVPKAHIPVIDIAALRSDSGEERSRVTQEIKHACLRWGFFQVVNHGMTEPVLDDALSACLKFFESPQEAKQKYLSTNVFNPTRYSTGLKTANDSVQFWRMFLKHYGTPLSKWAETWPEDPSDYREKMGNFLEEFKRVSLDVIPAVIESLGVNPTKLTEKFKEGMDVVTVNCYPPCPQPELALGLPPHTDFGCVTILHQSDHGLEVFDEEDQTWKSVPAVPGALQVHIGDQFEALSNGIYKSVLHRATLNNVKTRISIAVQYSLDVDEQIHTAEELIDDEHPRKYKPSSLREFLNFLSRTDVAASGKNYGETLKIEEN